jgi:Skp family chaperone for outer membrane proteins
VKNIRLSVAARAAAVLVAVASMASMPWSAHAQSQDWFVPGQARPHAAGQQAQPARAQPSRQAPVRTQGTPSAAPAPIAPDLPDDQQSAGAAPGQPQVQVQLPPPPDLPPIAKGVAPPAAVIGVLGVPDVMRASTAAQQIERVIGERRAKFNEDAQKEQASWRELQQSFAAQRGSLTPDQIRARERELQDRITNAQRQFRDRERIIQEAARYALAQIERTLVGVIRQVAESRGMNLVLHRAQVALNVNEFDLTEQVAEQLNKVLPTVAIPPEGQAPPTAPIAAAKPPATLAGAAPPASAAPAPPAASAAPPPPAISAPPAPAKKP